MMKNSHGDIEEKRAERKDERTIPTSALANRTFLKLLIKFPDPNNLTTPSQFLAQIIYRNEN